MKMVVNRNGGEIRMSQGALHALHKLDKRCTYKRHGVRRLHAEIPGGYGNEALVKVVEAYGSRANADGERLEVVETEEREKRKCDDGW